MLKLTQHERPHPGTLASTMRAGTGQHGPPSAMDGRGLDTAYNIIRKAAPNAFGTEGVEDGKAVLAALVVHPVSFVIPPSRSQKGKS
ncbi:MAG: hypothetical protein JO202_17270 [Ktedonobacteraceae bacterium]|nr:hypothetical protein [Ktedonobacteraceae bacterium]